MLLTAIDPSSPAVAESRLLHGRVPAALALPRFVCVANARGQTRKGIGWAEKLYPAAAMDGICRAVGSSSDHYISQATFVTTRRLASGISSLRCAFVDLDTYNVGITPEAAAERVNDIAICAGLPLPTHLVSSGRGLYVRWVFTNEIEAAQLHQWRALQNALIFLYAGLGADPAVRDPSRVLRLLGSTNSKADRTASMLSDSGRLHSFEAMCQSIAAIDMPQVVHVARAKAQQARTASAPKPACAQGERPNGHTNLTALANYSLTREPVMMKAFSAQSLNWNRFLDLRDLILIREDILPGQRDTFLFWAMAFLAGSGVINPANMQSEMQSLLMAFPVCADFQPEQDGSMNALMSRIRRHYAGEVIEFAGGKWSPIYTPNNETLLNTLQITGDEERRLRTVISEAEKLRRADAKVPGRQERRTLRLGNRMAAVALHEQGLSASQIGQQLQTSTSTVYRWLKADPAVGETFVESRGRKRRTFEIRSVVVSPHKHEDGGAAVLARPPNPPPARRPRPEKVRAPAPHHRTPTWGEVELARWRTERRTTQERLSEILADQQQWHRNAQEARKVQIEMKIHLRLNAIRRKILSTEAAADTQQRPGSSNAPPGGPPQTTPPPVQPRQSGGHPQRTVYRPDNGCKSRHWRG